MKEVTPYEPEVPLAFRETGRIYLVRSDGDSSSKMTWLVSGGSLSLHLQGIPAPQVQPSSSSHAILGWFSQTHPRPKHFGQLFFMYARVLSKIPGPLCL